MSKSNNILNTIATTSDTDLLADSGFNRTFSGLVNLLYLMQSLYLGLYSLFIENALLSSTHLTFCVFFMTYFFSVHFFHDRQWITIAHKTIIFFYTIIVHISGLHLNIVTLPLSLYPFIALLLHGRHLGVSISIAHLGAAILFYIFYNSILEIHNTSQFVQYIVHLSLVQTACTTIFFIAIRWTSGLIYSKNRELNVLNEEITVKNGIITRLNDGIEKPLSEIHEAVDILRTERLAPIQSELVGLIRASTLNATNTFYSVKKAASHNIPMLPQEKICFNIYTLLNNLLKLFKCKDPSKRHSFALASNVPETILGNSILTRQILLNVLDALENKIGLAEYDLKLFVTRDDVYEHDIVLHYSIVLDYQIKLDRREIASIETRIIDYLELGVTRNIIESENGAFSVATDDEGLHIDFTLRYEDAELLSRDSIFTDSPNIELPQNIPIGEANVLVVTADDTMYAQAQVAVGGIVQRVKRATSPIEAVNIFTDSKIDIILADSRAGIAKCIRMMTSIRAAESGVVSKVPVLIFIDGNDPTETMQYTEAGFDMLYPLPFDIEVARAAVCSYFV